MAVITNSGLVMTMASPSQSIHSFDSRGRSSGARGKVLQWSDH